MLEKLSPALVLLLLSSAALIVVVVVVVVVVVIIVWILHRYNRARLSSVSPANDRYVLAGLEEPDMRRMDRYMSE